MNPLTEEKQLIIGAGLKFAEFKPTTLPVLSDYKELDPPRDPAHLILPIASLFSPQHYVHAPTVAKYRQMLRAHQKLKPIRISITTEKFNVIANGVHRTEALLESGKTTVEAIWF
jgi:hypothetical protein